VKLTKEILKKLIKEEFSRMTNEMMMPGSPEFNKVSREAMEGIEFQEDAAARIAELKMFNKQMSDVINNSGETKEINNEKIQNNFAKINILNMRIPGLRSKTT